MAFSFKKYYLLFLLFFIIKQYIFSQTDSSYIKSYTHKLSARVFISKEFNTIFNTYLLTDITYQPNNPFSTGIGFSGDRVGFSISYGFKSFVGKEKGSTESFDFQYHFYGKKFIFDAIGQIYDGFFVDDYENNAIHLHKNLKTLKTGIFAQYVFNSEKFSYRAAYNQREIQIKSAGGFLLGGGMYYNEIYSDIPNFFDDTTGNKIKLTNFQFGPSIGYAYSWILTQRLYLFFSISGGINAGFNDKQKKVNAYPTAIPRFAIGYNGKSWSLNFSYLNDYLFAYFVDDRQIAVSSGGFQFSFIKRFYTNSKILKIL